MRLQWWPEPVVASWLAQPGTPWARLVTFGPAGFEAYARLRFIPDPTRPGQHEADVELPDDHRPDLAQAQQALHRLAAFTTTPDECYFGVWEGYSTIGLPPEAPLFELPHRRYAILRGSVRDIDGWSDEVGGGSAIPPAFVWPADRRWCFASDVDPHWAGIGAARAAVEALLAEPGLDVVPADPAAAQPSY